MMSPNEICRSYRQAKNKKEQIKILADLNCTTTEEIEKALVDCGEALPPKEKVKSKRAPAQKQSLVMPEAVEELIHQRMDELDKLMKPLEDELEPLRREYKEIAAFLMGCGKECNEQRTES